MLCYNGLAMDAKANEHKRAICDSSRRIAQAITGPYRQTHPRNNNERQAIHEHVSAALATGADQKRFTARRQRKL